MKRFIPLTLPFLLIASAALTGCSDDETENATGSTQQGGGGSGGMAMGGMGGDGGSGAAAGMGGMGGMGGDGGQGAFVITSTAFAEGEPIPTAHTCDGIDISPALSWSGAPAGTMSYAIILRDLDFGGYLHWIIWEIPAATTSLPEDVDQVFQPPDVPGAKQTQSFAGNRGYAGPCSPTTVNTYQFSVFALPTATQPALDMTSNLQEARDEIEANALGSASLTGES